MTTTSAAFRVGLLAAVLAFVSTGAFAELTQGAKVIVVHGSGDGSGSSDNNGGAYRGDVAWSDFQDADGGPIDTATNAAVGDNGAGLVRILSAGAFDDARVDIFAGCDFNTGYADGAYAVVAVDPAGDYIDIELAYTGDTLADVNVGGALASPQTAVNRVDQGDCVRISGGPYTVAEDGSNIINCTVAVDGEGNPPYAAMWNTITIEGVNEAGELDWNDKVVLDCSMNNVAVGVSVGAYYRIRNLEIVGASSYGIGRSGVDNVIVEGCTLRQCGGGLYLDNTGSVVRCLLVDNDNRGIYADNKLKVVGCIFRNNAGGGVRMYNGEVLYSTISSDQPDVTLINIASGGAVIAGTTLDGGGRDGTIGIHFSSADGARPLVLNTIVANCDTGVAANTDVTRAATMYNNLYSGNVNDVDPNGFMTTGVNPVFGDPAFADPASGDYRLTADSTAIGAGFDSTMVQFGSQPPYDAWPTGTSKIIAVHGTGDGSAASDTNGGAYRGGVTWGESQGPNGGPLDTASSATVQAGSGSTVRIVSPGAFAHSLIDVYARCDFGSVYADGIYPITAVDPAGDYIEIDLAWSASDSVDVNVGGALATPQHGLDIVGQGDYVKIAGGPYTTSNGGALLNCTVSVDTSAAATNMITVEGVNAAGQVDWADKVVLDCRNANVSSGISLLPHYRVRNFEVLGATSTGIGDSSVDSCIVEQCIARDSAGIGLRVDNGGLFFGCQSHDNGSDGFDGDGAVNIIGCVARNNRHSEATINYGMIMFSTLSSTGPTEMLIRISEQWTQPWYVVNNTLDGEGQADVVGMQLGLNLASTAPFVVLNNSVINCEDGVISYGDMTRQTFFYNNLYHNNTNAVGLNGHVTVGYDAVFGDPNFADPDGGDYRLDADSVAADAGFDSAWVAYGESGMAIGAAGLDIGSHQYLGAAIVPGDANGDGHVDLEDFVILKTNFGAISNATQSQGDFDGDGDVDLNDFVILKTHFGT